MWYADRLVALALRAAQKRHCRQRTHALERLRAHLKPVVRHKLCEVNGEVTAVGRVAQPARGADALLIDLSRVDI